MESGIKHEVFEPGDFPVDESFYSLIQDEEKRYLIENMLSGGYYTNGINPHMFLRPDLSINLDKLALAVLLAVEALELNSPDSDVTLNVVGLDAYYKARGIKGNERQEREERVFLMGFITGEALEASNNDTLVVKFV